MTLWLLLDWDKFNIVLQFNKELVIDSDLSQKIFELTAGPSMGTNGIKSTNSTGM